jgi:hypothetical protein
MRSPLRPSERLVPFVDVSKLEQFLVRYLDVPYPFRLGDVPKPTRGLGHPVDSARSLLGFLAASPQDHVQPAAVVSFGKPGGKSTWEGLPQRGDHLGALRQERGLGALPERKRGKFERERHAGSPADFVAGCPETFQLQAGIRLIAHLEVLGSVWTFLDLTPLGRQEEWEDSRRRDCG